MRLAIMLLLPIVVIWSNGCGDAGGNGGAGPSNNPPVIGAQPDTSVAIGDSLVLWARAHDADGDELTYTAAAHITYEEFMRGYYPDAGMDPAAGRFRFCAQTEDSPGRQFTFFVDDGRGGVDSTTFTISVN